MHRIFAVLLVAGLLVAGSLVASVGLGQARAQESPPLAPYVPPPTSAALAPLPGDPAGLAAEPPPGNVRARSDTSSNISAADTSSPIAPALPDPAAAGDTPRQLLTAARIAVVAGRTGAAQEALERAESRLLSRDVAPSAASSAIEEPMIGQIGDARAALSVGNAAAALRAIDAALQQG